MFLHQLVPSLLLVPAQLHTLATMRLRPYRMNPSFASSCHVISKRLFPLKVLISFQCSAQLILPTQDLVAPFPCMTPCILSRLLLEIISYDVPTSRSQGY